jgi:hypothetical protein
LLLGQSNLFFVLFSDFISTLGVLGWKTFN